MKDMIKLREMKKSDERFIEEMIREAWHYDEMCSIKTAQKMARAFLTSCLTNQTYTQVVVLNHQPIGVIMGKDKKQHKCPISYRWKQIIAIIRILLDKEGRKIASIFKDVNRIDQQLLKESQTDYQGELSFFVMNAKYRGLGIGKRLFSSLLEYMQHNHVNHFYLYTDTSCNYMFYEHQGMQRRAEKEHTFQIEGHEVSMSFFLYEFKK